MTVCELVGTKGVPTIRAASGGSNQGLLRRCTRTVFRWPSAPTRRIGGRIGDGLRAHGFRNKVGVLAQAVAGALDMYADGVVKKSVEQRSRDHGISKNLTPLGKATIRSQNHRALLVAGVDQLEKQVAGGSADGEIADLIDDVGERRKVHAVAGTDGLDAKRRGQATLSRTRLTDEVDDLVVADEVELCEGKDPVAVERGLEREIEAGQGLDTAEASHLERRFDAAAFANGDLFGEQQVDGLDRADLAAFELLDDVVERLQRAACVDDQMTSDALDRRLRQHVASH